MSETRLDPKSAAMLSAVFAQMVMQQTNMTLMLLGKIPNPSTNETMRDVSAAQYFIEQMEMLEVKTKGNLTPEEAATLKHSLLSLRMAFVEAVDAPLAKTPATAPATAPEKAAVPPAEANAAAKNANPQR